MILTFRPIEKWPAGWDPKRPPGKFSPFKATYQSTLKLLDLELAQLRATSPVLQLDCTERDCRLDGQLRASARPGYPGVILSFETKKYGPLSYPCNAFTDGYSQRGWQANLRTIALGLEALRKVDRYGIAPRGEQYSGWAQLGSGIPMPARAMTVEEAAKVIADACEDPNWSEEIANDPLFALVLFKDAAKLHHPDLGGDPEVFKRLVEARDLLQAQQ